MPAKPIAVLLACAASIVLPGRLEALCLGCPPAAWQVVLNLADGTEVHGYVELSAFLAAEQVDLTGREPPGLWNGHAPETLEVWTRALAVRHVYDGYCFRAYGEAAAPPARCAFSLPDRHLFLIGEPRTIPVAKVARIEDASCHGSCLETFLALRVTEGEAERLVPPPLLALQAEVGNDGAVLYCFADDPALGIEDLVALCRHHPHVEQPPPIPPGVVRVFLDPGT